MLKKIRGFLAPYLDMPERTFPIPYDSDEPYYPPLKDYFLKGQFLKDKWFWIVLAIIVVLCFLFRDTGQQWQFIPRPGFYIVPPWA